MPTMCALRSMFPSPALPRPTDPPSNCGKPRAAQPPAARFSGACAAPLVPMQLTLVTASGKRHPLELEQEQLTAAALAAAAARGLGLAPAATGALRLVSAGQALSDDAAVSRLKDGGAREAGMQAVAAQHGRCGRREHLPLSPCPPAVAARAAGLATCRLSLIATSLHRHPAHIDTVLAVVAPKAPPKALRDAVSGGGSEDDDDEALLRLRLPPDAPAWQRSLARWAQRARVPEAALALLLRVSGRFWLGLLAWCGGARLAASYELGPPYIVVSMLTLMLLNLGQRREGEWRCAGPGVARHAAGRGRRGGAVGTPPWPAPPLPPTLPHAHNLPILLPRPFFHFSQRLLAVQPGLPAAARSDDS